MSIVQGIPREQGGLFLRAKGANMRDIKETADRLQRLKDGESVESVYSEELFGMESSRFEFEQRKDRATLADAYLTEHDHTPIDEATFRELVGRSDTLSLDEYGTITICNGKINNATRGQLLRLLAALKEPT